MKKLLQDQLSPNDKMLIKVCFTFLVSFICIVTSLGQASIPFDITNNSVFSDEELYIAIVGKTLDNPAAHVWVDMLTGQQMPMDPSYNTVQGPVYNGNLGPGGNGRYADCFTRLSDIPNKRVDLAPIQGCRMFISVGGQLYLYFFGSTGAQVGYAAPSHTNPSDPNTGIVYELVELTYNQIGLWANTSRVDSYNYAMGLEVYGENDFFIRTGELLSHEEIGEQFLENVPAEFQSCYHEETGQIFQPTKTPEWSDGTIAGWPVGPYSDYMQPYIDQVWQKYTNQDLLFINPDIGTWSGRVNGSGALVFTCISGPAGFIGEQGIIEAKPNTQEALEGKGVLDRPVGNTRFDLMMQAQFCAALTRHVVDVTSPNPGVQQWGDVSNYYQSSPSNHYAKFWHLPGVRVDQKAYGFAYDDVFDQSSTLHTPQPTGLKAIFGGFANDLTIQSPYDGVRQQIPGVIEAEFFDEGGQGIAYADMTIENQGNDNLRNESVDIEIDGNRRSVGYLETGEWLEYSVNVRESGLYDVKLSFAADDQFGGGEFRILLDDQELIANTSTGTTGGWTNWDELEVSSEFLDEGDHLLKFEVLTGNFNLDKISFNVPTLTSSFERDVSDVDFNIYPNPVSEFMSLHQDYTNEELVLMISDISGKEVMRFNQYQREYNLNALKPGIYNLQLFSKNQFQSLKLIKE